MRFKKWLLLGLAALAASMSLPLVYMAACGSTYLIANRVCSSYQSGINTADLGTTVLTRFWAIGNSNGANSGTMLTSSMAAAWGGGGTPCSTYSGVYADWGDQANVVGCPVTGCPSACSYARTAFLYSVGDDTDPVTAGVQPGYIIISVGNDSVTASYNLDLVTNGTGGTNSPIEAPVSIPQLTITNTTKIATGSYDVTVTWPPIAKTTASGSTTTDLGGYYDTYPGASNNVVTGIAVYYVQRATAPSVASDFAVTSWILAAGNGHSGYNSWGLTGADVGGPITVNVPVAATGNATYLGIRMLFDGWTPSAGGFQAATDFVGQASAQIGPTPAGVFAGFDAKLAMGTVTATWRSNAESGLAFYQVYASKLVGGPYVPINGTLTSPMGDSHVYTATFPFPKEIGKRKVFLKVKATDMDGTEWWTQPVKVARRTAP